MKNEKNEKINKLKPERMINILKNKEDKSNNVKCRRLLISKFSFNSFIIYKTIDKARGNNIRDIILHILIVESLKFHCWTAWI